MVQAMGTGPLPGDCRVSERHENTIQAGDVVTVRGEPPQRLTVARVWDGPASIAKWGPFAVFVGGGHWRVSELEKVA